MQHALHEPKQGCERAALIKHIADTLGGPTSVFDTEESRAADASLHKDLSTIAVLMTVLDATDREFVIAQARVRAHA